jgi:hypothetical protein
LQGARSTTATAGAKVIDTGGERVGVTREGGILERRSRREATGLSEALRRCVDEWAAAQDAMSTQSKQEAIKKQVVAAGTQPMRRRTRRKAK